MTNRIRDASWIEPIGYGSRHGPYARGEPLIRGKPTVGVGVYNSNITDLESPHPENWLQWESRVLAAKKPEDEVGVFIPNRDCFAEKVGRRKKVAVISRSFQKEKRTVAVFSPEKPVPICREETGNSPGQRPGIKCNADFVAPRLAANYEGAVSWGKNKMLLAGRNRLAHPEEAEKNRSLSSQYIKNGSLKREESFQSQSQFAERKECSLSLQF